MVATGRVTLVTSVAAGEFSFLVYAPVYRHDVKSDSVKTRRDYLQGYVLGVFVIGDMFRETLRRLKPAGIDIYLYDTSVPKNEDLLYYYPADKTKTLKSTKKVKVTGMNLEFAKTFNVAGRKWLLLYRATPAFMAGRRTLQPWGVLAVGLLLTGTLWIYLLNSIRRTEYIENLVKIRTTELEQTNEMLSQEVSIRRQAENELHQAHGMLEKKVDERTAELSKLNKLLQESHQKLEKAYNDLKSAQSQILQQEKMASIGQLAAGVAHEINNPTGYILSNLNSLEKYSIRYSEYVSFLNETVAELKDCGEEASSVILDKIEQKRKALKIDYVLEDTKQLIHETIDGAEKIRRIVQDLKSFSHVDDAECRPYNINEGLESTINIAWNELKYKATVKREYGDIPLVRCNLGQLNQVFINLLVNAAQAIEKQGEITVKTWHAGDYVYVSVADTGSGIPEEKIGRIFEPFFTTKEVGKGTGLGLSIAYDIVKKHTGEIEVASEVDKGTTFTIKIPV